MLMRPLSPALGVEVGEVDLDTPLAARDAAALRRAYDDHHLVLVRGGCVSVDAQARFAALFGPVLGTAYVSNTRGDGIIQEGALLFHSDLAFSPHPYLGLSLHALELPAAGTSTFFANAVAAAAALPASLMERVRGLHAQHAFDLHTQKGDSAAVDEPVPSAAGRATHPIVLRHPRTGVEVLYVNQMQTERIVELAGADSRALLGELFAHLYSSRFVYEHRWQLGDLIVWDNIALQHARADPAATPRTLQRVTLAEVDPLAAWVPGAPQY